MLGHFDANYENELPHARKTQMAQRMELDNRELATHPTPQTVLQKELCE